MPNRKMEPGENRGEASVHGEFVRIKKTANSLAPVPHAFRRAADAYKFDVQVCTPGCLVWHHVFSLCSEEQAQGLAKYIRYNGANVRDRRSHVKKCRAH